MRKASSRIVLLALSVAFASLAFAPAGATIHTVNQVSTTFNPNTLTIVEGDTVRWQRSSGSHTVTNGTGAADPNAGTLFDEPLNSLNPTFEYVFTVAGSYPYFCRPHESFDMRGTITVDVPSGVGPPAAVTAALHQNHPNPFGAGTSIAFTLSAEATVTLAVFDVRGRLVAVLDRGFRSSGPHHVSWDGTDLEGARLPSGVYHYRLQTGDAVLTRRLVLLR
jgi:plastocyanin